MQPAGDPTCPRGKLAAIERRLARLEQDQARQILQVRSMERFLEVLAQRIVYLQIQMHTDFHRTLAQTVDQLQSYTDNSNANMHENMDAGFLASGQILELYQQRLHQAEMGLKDVCRRLGHLMYKRK
jgi:adenylate cyclase